jgi:hypothetical protein
MRILMSFIAGVVLSTNLLAENRGLDSLDDLRWKNRVVLVNDTTDRTVDVLAAHRAAIEERHIIWFCVVNGEILSNYQGALEDRFLAHLRKDYFERWGFPVLLIGKDGGIKSSNTSLDIDDYFKQIDSMPMRQAEMAGSTSD